ncbi:MAG TPA: YceH family protein [Thermoanaerobaculia bacterium]
MSTRIPRPLDTSEIRILGALLEKEQTTPDLYPLTVAALLGACNQKTNREPVLELTETEVVDALERLRAEVLVWRSEGARSEKWSQSVSRRWGLDTGGKRAILTLLLLRGAQTPGELKSRSDRLHPFASLAEVEETLARLAADEDQEPLVAELPRRPGQKETRWTHLVGDPAAPSSTEARPATGALGGGERPMVPVGPPLSSRVERLEAEVARLAADLAALRRELE